MRVLIVEDEPKLAQVIERNLEAHGYEARCAATAADALARMAEEWPDVLLLDVNLPDFSGWEVLRRAGNGGGRRTKVIVMSAAPVSQKRVEEFRPDHVLQKPFLMGALLRAVEEPAAMAVDGEETEAN